MNWINLAQNSLHYSLHFAFPLVLAKIIFPTYWKKAYAMMLASMFMDLDHLFAVPIFDPNRCGINFHFLHSEIAIFCYVLLSFSDKYRAFAVGFLFHVFTDSLDCFLMNVQHALACKGVAYFNFLS